MSEEITFGGTDIRSEEQAWHRPGSAAHSIKKRYSVGGDGRHSTKQEASCSLRAIWLSSGVDTQPCAMELSPPANRERVVGQMETTGTKPSRF